MRETRMWRYLSRRYLSTLLYWAFEQRLMHPVGSLTTGQGNRFVLASTQELHEKITELCSRVRELEDALRVSHNQNSSDEHPLLSEELLRIKAPLQREALPRNPTLTNEQEEASNPDVVDSFGTLRIARRGLTHYYGQFANSWVCTT